MNIERTATFKRDYLGLNAAAKMRTDVALGRLVSHHSDLQVRTVDFEQGTEAAIVDDFLCITFERIQDGIRLLNVRSIEIAGSS